jgi:hypothetical protein
VLPAAGERDQSLVGLEAQQRRGPGEARHAAVC